MKYLLVLCLVLTGCVNYPQYCGVDYQRGVVNWRPNPNVGNNTGYMQYNGSYYQGCYYPPINYDWYYGPYGWQRGFNYPYKY